MVGAFSAFEGLIHNNGGINVRRSIRSGRCLIMQSEDSLPEHDRPSGALKRGVKDTFINDADEDEDIEVVASLPPKAKAKARLQTGQTNRARDLDIDRHAMGKSQPIVPVRACERWSQL